MQDKADLYSIQLKQTENRLSNLLTVYDQYDRQNVDMKVLRLTNVDLVDRTSRAYDDVKSAREEVKDVREHYRATLEFQKNSLILSHERQMSAIKSEKHTLELELKAKKDDLHHTQQLLKTEEQKNTSYTHISSLGANESIKLGSFKEKAVVRYKERKDKRRQASETLQFARQPSTNPCGYTGGFGHRPDLSSQRNEILSQFINRSSHFQSYDSTKTVTVLNGRNNKKKKAAEYSVIPKPKRKPEHVIQLDQEFELEAGGSEEGSFVQEIEELSASESDSEQSREIL